jgi:hypothetical protein
MLSDQWMTVNVKRTLWLPLKYRPRLLQVKDELLNLAQESGDLSFMEFDT